MSESTSKKSDKTEPSFSLNYATAILFLMILIPIVYTLVSNLQKPVPPPVIIPTVNSVAASNPANVIEINLKAVADNPGFQSYLNLGLAYYNVARYEEGIAAWKKALEYNPKSDLAYNNIAAAYGAMNKWDEEISACKKALAINPNLDLAKRNMDWAKEMKSKNK